MPAAPCSTTGAASVMRPLNPCSRRCSTPAIDKQPTDRAAEIMETVLNREGEQTAMAGERAADAGAGPPRRWLGLGLRLGLFTTLVVTGVMAAVSGTQLALELRTELRERQAQLIESLHPLIIELQTAVTPEDARSAILRVHSAYEGHGHAYHFLGVANATGQVLIGAPHEGVADRQPLLTAAVPLMAPALGPESVELLVKVDGSGFFAARAQRWWGWALHVGVTALLILALLFIVIRREVTGPIDRLLGGVRKMERGYWDDMPDPGGAWEIRWLGWRFRALGQELSRTVEHLVAAQRRAYTGDGQRQADSPLTMGPPPATAPSLIHQDAGEAVRRLQVCLERLMRADPGDTATRSLAQIVWDHGTTEAERIGQPELRIKLEDAALRVLDPDGFHDISTRIEAERPRLEASARARGAQIRRALAARGVPNVEVCHRVKHAAGQWKKMRHKSLAFEQVHDLVALRIVVPTEADCYHALGVVHDLYVPVVGRFKDYIVLPKPNGYRGLHTSVRDADDLIFEVQIRSVSMHRHAEHGEAAHADYKDATWIPVNGGRMASWKRLLGAVWQPPERGQRE
ncbi:MAG: hypothetical protein C0505_16335 [Leptothrix sp. (in: Bacteria)]|nr:hypothetical protein [Leptothrix sp. (in: b-proteobacteria)]